jgi:sulfur-oxidizing protein SoxX
MQMGLKQSQLVLATAIGVAMLGLNSAFAAPPDAKALVIGQCQQCHEIKGIGDFGNIGPSLVDLKARYADRKDVVEIVNDETKRNPQTVMPPFGRNLILTKQEIESIVDYLYNQ